MSHFHAGKIGAALSQNSASGGSSHCQGCLPLTQGMISKSEEYGRDVKENNTVKCWSDRDKHPGMHETNLPEVLTISFHQMHICQVLRSLTIACLRFYMILQCSDYKDPRQKNTVQFIPP